MIISRLPAPTRLVLWATALGALIGGVYGQIRVAESGQPFFASYGVPRGVMTGAVIAGALSSLEAFVLSQPMAAPLRRAPFAAHVAVKTFIYLAVVLLGLKVGATVMPSPGDPGVEGEDVLVSLAAAFVFVFMIDVNTLLGQNVLLSFVTGRYYLPRLETRAFLFIDMEGSTGLAERLGPLVFHRLLNRFVNDLSEPIVAAGGEIYSYVGDELIATWKFERDDAPARCVAACFAALDRLVAQAPDYRREFGAAPACRAGLHCGSVVTGEMGSVKKEIVFLGDTVNTAARIQDLCRQTGDRVLASAELVGRGQLPAGIVKRPLGDLRLRGKGADLALYALTKPAEDRAGATA
jgi:adenylate cyclase